MAELGAKLTELVVQPGTGALAWLGQAGFAIKSSGGTIALVDPYLSEYAEIAWGLRRAVLSPLEPGDLTPDLILVTHWHEDHLDKPTLLAYRDNPAVTLVAPASSLARASAWGWPAERQVRIERGETIRFRDFEITATFARHDEFSAPVPDAIGFRINAGDLRIWNVGDSEYDARLRDLRNDSIDVMLVPINGVGGNMNAYEAALLTWWVDPPVAVPTHYDMWTPDDFGPGATLDPEVFASALRTFGSSTVPFVMDRGDIAVLTVVERGATEGESDE
jgi:L-ascorbate metabolism protein UlaG (beta-lactamase superfamily)